MQTPPRTSHLIREKPEPKSAKFALAKKCKSAANPIMTAQRKG